MIGALLPWRRSIQFVAKVELFEKRWQGWILSRLGAFPIRRGQSDETAVETARLAVERGGTVVIFPEGTRIRRGSLARPKRGVGRLALETGAPVMPVAVIGTEHVRNGWLIRPRKVCLRAGSAMTFPQTERPSPSLAQTVTERIWPNIELQWEYLGGLPPLRKAAVIGAGSWGTAVAALSRAAGSRFSSAPATRRRPPRSAQARENEEYLPGVKIPEGVEVKQAADIELAGCDLVCLAVPSKAIPQAVGTYADRIGSRAAVLLLSKGLIQPHGPPADRLRLRADPLASDRLPGRTGARARGGRRHGGTRPRLCRSDLRVQLGEVFDRAGLVASGPTTSSASRWPAWPRTPPPLPPRQPSRMA